MLRNGDWLCVGTNDGVTLVEPMFFSKWEYNLKHDWKIVMVMLSQESHSFLNFLHPTYLSSEQNYQENEEGEMGQVIYS